MQFRVGAVDGKTYESVVVSDEELQEELDKLGGKIGTGGFDDVIVNTPDEFVDFMRDFLKGNIEGVSPTELTLRMEGDVERVFPMSQVVWWEILR